MHNALPPPLTLKPLFPSTHPLPRRLLRPHPPRALVRRPLQDLTDTTPDQLGRLRRVDRRPQALVPVIIDHRARLGVVRRQPLFQRFRVVVRTLDERFAGLIVRHGFFGGVDWGEGMGRKKGDWGRKRGG